MRVPSNEERDRFAVVSLKVIICSTPVSGTQYNLFVIIENTNKSTPTEGPVGTAPFCGL